MFATKHIVALLPILSTAVAQTSDYGFWSVNASSTSYASGYRSGIVAAEYSGAPGQTNQISWLYTPSTKSTSITNANPSFNSSLVDGQGVHTIEIEQTVLVDGANVTLTGSGSVTMTCGQGGNGEGCIGSTTVTATPA